MNTNKKNPKKSQQYLCEICNYFTYNKKDYNKHLLTNKHKITNFPNENLQKIPNETPIEKKFECICGKKYKHMSSLCQHKKKCKHKNEELVENQIINCIDENIDIDEDVDIDIDLSSKQLIQLLIKDNSDFKKMILDICKNIQPTTINQMNMNSNNKTFNLQVFLNETCKDAMNIMDFVNSVQLQLSDLENVGREGYVNGISNIIIKNLQTLDVEKRPIHCSDSKREILYIKDNDKWEKENDDKMKIKKVIKFIANKNSRLISKFKEKYPDCIYSDSDKSDQYNKLIIEAFGGMGDNDDEKYNKIIKKIAKSVVINKSIL
jgi:hypothetical protein